MSLRYFGTDGIRGAYGSEVMNDQIAFRAGKAAVVVAKSLQEAGEPKIVIGRDTRRSGERLSTAFARGVSFAGGTVIDLGIAPTPSVAFAAEHSSADLAVSLTASHNPASDNGIKFFSGSGVKPSAELEQALDDAVGNADLQGFDSEVKMRVEAGGELREAYLNAVLSRFEADLLSGLSIVVDCANGAMYELGAMAFRRLGATVTVLAAEPDGSNINQNVGSEHPEAVRAAYQNGNYDFGFAFDGDGDRVVLFDESGSTVKGEALLALLALDAKNQGKLVGDTLVTTIQSNLGLDSALQEKGINVERTDVGDKHIARRMLEAGFTLGGEESGHVVVGDFAVTGDGLVAALALAEIFARSKDPVSVLTSVYVPFPQSSNALRVKEKLPLESCLRIQNTMTRITESFARDGRLLVRYSGTEPKIRLLVEAKNQVDVDAAMSQLRDSVAADLVVE